MALLSCENLTLGYEGDVLIHDLTFQVEQGDYLCIVGENGSGKSTLMKTILGLRSPMSGSLRFGEGLTRREMGYLPQQTDIQRDFPATVREIVRSGMLGKTGLRPCYNAREKQRASEIMESLGLTPLERRCYRELSGGQQQRVLLARALCAADRMILLDEPATGLDPLVTEELYDTIARRNRQEGITVVMVSHDMDAALRSATHILHIGDAWFFGTREAYLESPVGKRYVGREAAE